MCSVCAVSVTSMNYVFWQQTSVQYDEIYQCRRPTAGASDTEKQSATLDKRAGIERAVQTARSRAGHTQVYMMTRN